VVAENFEDQQEGAGLNFVVAEVALKDTPLGVEDDLEDHRVEVEVDMEYTPECEGLKLELQQEVGDADDEPK
jgi:hypothetical protein